MHKCVFVVVVTYNAMPWIYRCLDSVKEYNVILVDNLSSDGTVNYVRQNFSKVNVLKQEQNLGFGAANNIGIKKAFEEKADYIFLLNQDAWIQSDTIEKLIEVHHKYPDYGILSPMHLNGKGDALDYNFSTFINPSNCKNLYSDIFLKKTLNQVYKVTFVNAAAWLISRKCLENVGGFNPSFYHYGEDDNYIQRAQFHKFKTGVFPNSHIYHDRENREESVFFVNKSVVYRRSIIHKMSSPFYEYSLKNEYFSICKELFIALLFFRINQLKWCIKKVLILKKLDTIKIKKNKMETILKKPSFLN